MRIAGEANDRRFEFVLKTRRNASTLLDCDTQLAFTILKRLNDKNSKNKL